MSYEIVREFAATWMLVILFGLFVGVCAWAWLRPGARRDADRAASIPFRETDDRDA